MKSKAGIILATILFVGVAIAQAQTPKLDGAYKFVSVKFQGGERTEAQSKGMIVVHGNYMAFVQSDVDRPTWTQQEPEADRMKKVAQAYNGLRATAGKFEIKGNKIVLNQIAQASPSSMGKPSEWEFTLSGNKLTLKPAGATNVEFTFERLP
jgi:hypothetical protein